MPIKPENRARYPENWKKIRAQILSRAKHRCEFCGLPDYAVGQRLKNGRFIPAGGNLLWEDAGRGWNHTEGRPLSFSEAKELVDFCNESHEEKYMFILLTVAHLDHQPENNDPENLRALCQRCHLRYDAKHHATNAKATLKQKKHKGQTTLFDA